MDNTFIDKNNKKGLPFKNIIEKLKFVAIFRPIVASLIILSFVVSDFFKESSSTPITKNIIYFVLSIIILLTVLYGLVLKYFKNKRSLRFFVYFGFIQLSLDFIFIFLVVLYSGGLSSKLIFLFYLLVLTASFLFLNLGSLVSSVSSAIAIGIIANMQYYFDFGLHHFFSLNPDKLLFLTSINILGVLIIGSFLYHFSNGIKVLSEKIIEREEFIKTTQNFNMELINSFSQGIIVLNEKYRLVFINHAALEILNINDKNEIFLNKTGIPHNFNLKITDIINNFPVNIFYKNQHAKISEDDNVEENSKIERFERFEISHKEKILGFSYNGESSGKHILLFRDISFIKKLEAESKINEALSTAGKFAAWLAHEIRNPLLAVNTSVDILQSEEHIASEKYEKLTGIIKDETIRLNNLVNDFLHVIKKDSNVDFTYKTAGHSNKLNDKCNLYETVEELIFKARNHFDEKININLYNRIDRNLYLNTKKYRLQQVFNNLLSNATQSIKLKNEGNLGRLVPGNGTVRFSSVFLNKESVIISIADNGAGMDDFVLKNAFMPLFTTKQDGNGLGLPLVKSIIEDLGGEIKVRSKLGKGTLIMITLKI